MRFGFRTTLLAFATIAAISSVTFADRARGAVLFLTIGPGARPAGMGEAFCAVADDPTATYWNPAGLGRYPLSSRWYSFPTPDSETQFFAAVKTRRADTDFRKYDLWIATPTSLWLNRKNKWISEEIYNVDIPEGISLKEINDVIYEFAETKTYDSTYINQLKQKILDYNGIHDTLIPQGTEIKIPFKYFVPDTITALAGGDNVLWIGTTHGLYRYADGVWSKVKDKGAPTGEITVLAVDNDENVWAGTQNGLYVNRGPRWNKFTTADGLPSNKITAVYPVEYRDTWVGTERGIAHFNGASWKTDFTYTPSAGATWEDVVTQLCGAKNKQRKMLLVSTLQAYNKVPESNKLPEQIKVPYNLIMPRPVTAIYVDPLGRVWFGSELGVVRLDENKFKVFGWSADSLTQDITVEKFVEKKWKNVSENIRKELINKIKTFGFLNNTSLKAGDFIEYPSSPLSGKVYDIQKGFAGNDVLIATEYGLLRYYPNLHQFRYVMSEGLSEKDVEKIIARGGEFWFGTSDEVKIYSKGKPGVSLMHVRWLPELAEDIYYEYLTGVYYLEGWGTVGGFITFISLGKSEQTSEVGELLGSFYSYETAIGVSYGAKLMKNLYGGLNFKIIYSALAPQIYVGHEKKSGTGTSFAVDLGLLYDGPISGMSWGVNVQHLGPNIQYIDAAQADPLPRNLKVGFAYRVLNTDYQKLIVAADIDKEIIRFKSPENPWALEWHYAVKHIGLEYSYYNFFHLRGGYIIDYDYYPKSEAIDKVNQPDYKYNPDDYISTNYFTFGVGIHYGKWAFDFAYIPKVSDPENKGQALPLSDIKRISITREF